MELIVGLALVGVVVGAATSLALAALRGMSPQRITVAGRSVAVAPSPAAFADAVTFHQVLQQRLSAARAVYVFGGVHDGLPSGSSPSRQLPLKLDHVPDLGGCARGLPLDASGFAAQYAASVGPVDFAAGTGAFSVLIIGRDGARLAATALVQVRSSEWHEAERVFSRQEATLFDLTGSAYRYEFLEDVAVARAVPIQARHFWYRFAEGLVAEEGPVVATFPDPSIYGGLRGDPEAEVPAFSRFTYVLTSHL